MNVSAFRNYLKGKGVKNDEMVYGQIEKALEGILFSFEYYNESH